MNFQGGKILIKKSEEVRFIIENVIFKFTSAVPINMLQNTFIQKKNGTPLFLHKPQICKKILEIAIRCGTIEIEIIGIGLDFHSKNTN